MSETPVAIESCSSQRTITITSVLFLLVLLPVQSQIPSQFQTPSGQTKPRGLTPIDPPSTEETSNPTNPRRPPFPPPPQNIETILKLANAAKLNATPRSVEVGQLVQFEVVFRPPRTGNPNVQYGFDFDDGSGTEWTSKPRTTHPYLSPGKYQASAVIRVPIRGKVLDSRKIIGPKIAVVSRPSPTPTATESVPPPTPTPTATEPVPRPSPTPTAAESVPITPAPPSPSPTAPATDGWRSWSFYIYMVSAGLAAAALYGILKLIKPTFHPHADWHEPQKPPQNVAINYGLYFHSNVSAGQDQLQLAGASLILGRRTQ